MSETNGRVIIPSPIFKITVQETDVDIDSCELCNQARLVSKTTDNDVDYFKELVGWFQKEFEVELLVGELGYILEMSWKVEEEFKKKQLTSLESLPVTESTQVNSTR